MAEALIKDMSTAWNPEKYHNEYRETMQKWLDKETAKLKKSGKKVSKAATQSRDSVVDFIALLKESMVVSIG
ncbi:Ku family protein [Legionella lytica]|uniref:hypothetical protein n=1 Tax=Legionella lytica TaxID=96232 RepID=UPI00208F1910|nr:hypothetical protein [Legionella lytica]